MVRKICLRALSSGDAQSSRCVSVSEEACRAQRATILSRQERHERACGDGSWCALRSREAAEERKTSLQWLSSLPLRVPLSPHSDTHLLSWNHRKYILVGHIHFQM